MRRKYGRKSKYRGKSSYGKGRKRGRGKKTFVITGARGGRRL